jgi:hypothetical protein
MTLKNIKKEKLLSCYCCSQGEKKPIHEDPTFSNLPPNYE